MWCCNRDDFDNEEYAHYVELEDGLTEEGRRSLHRRRRLAQQPRESGCEWKPLLGVLGYVVCVVLYAIYVAVPQIKGVSKWEPTSCNVTYSKLVIPECNNDPMGSPFDCSRPSATLKVHYCPTRLSPRCFRDTMRWSPRSTSGWRHHYRVGSIHHCYYDTTNPSESALELPYPVFVVAVLFGATALFTCALTPIVPMALENKRGFLGANASRIGWVVGTGFLFGMLFFPAYGLFAVPHEFGKARTAFLCLSCIFVAVGCVPLPSIVESYVTPGREPPVRQESIWLGVYCCLVFIPVVVFVPVAMSRGSGDPVRRGLLIATASLVGVAVLLCVCRLFAAPSRADRYLVVGARAGDEGVVAEMLERGAHVQAKSVPGATPLIDAALRGHHGVVDILLSRGADVNDVCEAGETALIAAVRRRDQVLVRRLLQHGANPLYEAPCGTALAVALELGQRGVALDLLRYEDRARLQQMLVGMRVGAVGGVENSLTRLGSSAILDRNVFGEVLTFLAGDVAVPFVRGRAAVVHE